MIAARSTPPIAGQGSIAGLAPVLLAQPAPPVHRCELQRGAVCESTQAFP
jgi:hypothetical protein